METPESFIDLRSDTVTKPTAAMRDAIASAPVGDDQYGEDPTMNELQQRIAELLGKPAALWLPSGTMANQVALRILTRPGDDVVVIRESHAVWHETGGSGANAGVQLTELGEKVVSPRTNSRTASNRAVTSCIRRRRWSRSRIRTIAPEAASFRNRRWNGSARSRVNMGSPASSTVRACGTQRQQACSRLRNSLRVSTWSLWRYRRDWDVPAAACSLDPAS